ncbi:MAG: Calcium-binding acidic-repeat protein precursor [Myxococcaceae bacterium]|nr:Calcium-binding acidic-repeat protein precursor [Myxococcaceae bacterium]
MLAALVLLGCTDSGLRGIPKPDDRIALKGEFCTAPPYDTVRHLKVLFVVDSSSSMRWTDPNDLLVGAIEHLTQRYATQNISFAIVRWGSSRVVRENVDYEPTGSDPRLFTADPLKLSAIYTRMRQPPSVNPLKYLDGTNFQLALGAAADYLIADIAQNPSATLTSRYVIEFITDGMPQSATDDPAITRRNIISAVDNLATRFDARVDVNSIAQNVVTPPEFLGLLPEMARVGGGTYTQLSSPAGLDAVFDATLSHGANLVSYQLDTSLVWNPHLRVGSWKGKTDAYLDSDGDGLIDLQEAELGTRPEEVDTDGDGLSDLFEVRAQGGYDPLAKNVYSLGADGGSDPDADELSTFEELRLGTNPESPDTDRDGVPDDIELAAGTNPVAADRTADPDNDGVPNGDELAEHTGPFSVEDQDFRDDWAYRPALETPLGVVHAVRCYGFEVENIALGLTLASVDREGRSRPAGFNELKVIVLSRAVLDRGAGGVANEKAFPVRSFRAHRYVVASPGGRRNPPTRELELRRTEFRP